MDKMNMFNVISRVKNVLLSALFIIGLLFGNEVNAQGCQTYFPGIGEPLGGLSRELCLPSPGFVDLDASVSFSAIYNWNTGSTNSAIFPLVGGSYSVTITSSTLSDTCILSYTVNQHSNPVINLGSDTSFCIGDTVTLNAPKGQNSYLWSNGLIDDSILVINPGFYWVLMTDTNTCVSADTINLSQDTLPIVVLAPDSAVCVGDSVSVDAGSGYSGYLWSTGDTSQVLVMSVSGTYDITVSDSNSCKGSDQFVLSNFIPPVVNIGTDDSLCTGNSKILDAGIGFVSYLWSDATALQTATFVTTSDPWVEVIDANGCMASDTMHLEIFQLPNLNLGVDDSICASQTYSLNAGNGGGSIISYLWSTGSANQTITIVSNPGLGADISVDYSVLVTDVNGCENRDTINLKTFKLPSPDLGPDTTFCVGDPFAMTLDPGAFVTYAWSTGATSPTLNIGAVGMTYHVTVTDVKGCVNEDDLKVTQFALPSPNLGPDDYYCQGSSFTKILNPGFFDTYLWSDNSSGQVLGVSTAGTYSVVVVDTNGCLNNDDIIITENPTPIVNLGPDATFCEDQTVSLFLDATDKLVGTGYNFLWNTNETSGTITAGNFGKYTVVVTDQATNCFATSSMTIIAMEKAQPDLGDDGVVCQGQLLNLDPKVTIGGYNYTWSTGATTTTINVFETGNYWVRLDAANGTCMGLTDTVHYTAGVLPVVELGADQYVCDGQNVTLLGSSPFPGAKYVWQDGTTETSFVATQTGDYEVEVSNECGSVVDLVYIEFQDCGNVYVPNSFTPNGDGTNDVFYPTSDQEFTEYGFWVYDRWGTLIFKTNIPNTGWDGMINGEYGIGGTYVWRISYVSSYKSFVRIEKTGEFSLIR